MTERSRPRRTGPRAQIVDLVDREADMLNRGRPEKSFKGCRQRLANLSPIARGPPGTVWTEFERTPHRVGNVSCTACHVKSVFNNISRAKEVRKQGMQDLARWAMI